MRRLFTLSLILISQLLTAQTKPKLVVGIVVDQMRQDYLLRFQDRFGEGGFNRLLTEGFQFRNAHYSYTPTYTAPGHASIYSGTTPSNHGIIGNSWYSREKGLSVYCTSDPSQTGVGGSSSSGKMSPKNLLASTITDELRLTTNFRAKVVGVSIKDRGSILPAGHNPTGAYWFDSKSGNFMTSTYYTEELPEWVSQFNQEKRASSYLKQAWEPLYPIETYVQSTDDKNEYERIYRGEKESSFPYDLKKIAKSEGIGLIRLTPFGNQLVLDMALASIEGEELGQDDITDFLAVSFSSTDYIGHQFGSNAIEIEDTYLRLDLEIKRLLDYLDANFKDEYTVFLTADHGVVNVPQFLMDNKMVGGYLQQEEIAEELLNQINETLGEGDWILDVGNDQLYLNHSLIDEKGLDRNVVINTISDILQSFDEISAAYTKSEILLRNSTDPFKQRIENGFYAQRSGDIAARLKPGYLSVSSEYGKKGTSHGSGYTYDTHVPMLFFGSGIRSGSSVRQVSVKDIAPTLSMLLNISLPNSATGKPLEELFD